MGVWIACFALFLFVSKSEENERKEQNSHVEFFPPSRLYIGRSNTPIHLATTNFPAVRPGQFRREWLRWVILFPPNDARELGPSLLHADRR